MILKFFTGVVIVLIFIKIIEAIFNSEKERCNDRSYKGKEKYKKVINKISNIIDIIFIVAKITFCISNIVVLIYGIMSKSLIFIILGAIFIITMIFYILATYTNKFDTITIFMFLTTITCYITYIIFFFSFQIFCGQNITTDVRKVNTINIVELQKVPYTNVSGTQFYIRSEPSLAYYYDIVTENGGSTTKVIDGYKNYVEKFEDDIYREDPHIDVFEVIKKSTNGYGKEYEKVRNYEYYIYVPKDSIYYTDKE